LAKGQSHHSQGHRPWNTLHQKSADDESQNTPTSSGFSPGFDEYRLWRKNLRNVWLISREKKTIWPTAMVIMALVRIVAPEGLSMPIIGVKQ